jgi:hypothetical protein
MYGVNVLDSALNVAIPFNKRNAIISEMDMKRPFLKDIVSPFNVKKL